jgi:diguanylate cyclase (GGDEF)-like protein
MTMIPSPKQCITRAPNHDVQVEMTQMAFRGLLPTLSLTTVGITIALGVIVSRGKSHTLVAIVAAMMVACIFRVCVACLFNAQAVRTLTPAKALSWEIAYGAATLLLCAFLAAATMYNFRSADLVGMVWCMLGSFAFCSGLAFRRPLNLWITQLCACAVVAPLTLCLMVWAPPELRATAILSAFYLYLFCRSASAKFTMAVDQLRTRHQLVQLTEKDDLTGLANRRRFLSDLEDGCRRAQPFAILQIDLDRFKAVNDRHGHAAGDALLRAVSDRLRRVVRDSDTVARLGGDEFAVIQAAPATKESARTLAQRINQELAAPFHIDGLTLRISSSIGIRLASEGEMNPDALTSSADEALYEVKRAGRNSFAFAGRA